MKEATGAVVFEEQQPHPLPRAYSAFPVLLFYKGAQS
jgi:hypothetical protein